MATRTATLSETVAPYTANTTLSVTASYGAHHPYDFKLTDESDPQADTIEITRDTIKEPLIP